MNRALSDTPLRVLPSGRAPERRVLEGTLVRLEPLEPTVHAAMLYRASHDSSEARDVWRYLPDGPFDSVDFFTEWVTRMCAAADRLPYAFRDLRTGRLGGMATYLDIRPAAGSMEIGYIWFAPFMQRTRQATECLFLMMRYVLDHLGYRRLQWRCNALNERSRAAATRLGFTFEGIFYQHMVVKGCNRDTAWYSILDHEWLRIRENFERWLAAPNFDARGRQIVSLRELNQRG